MSTKWGIASAGKISHDFVNALSTYGENSGHSVVAVAARSLDTAKEFAEKHNIPKAYEGKALFQACLIWTNLFLNLVEPRNELFCNGVLNNGNI